jgi:hypothetical protein
VILLFGAFPLPLHHYGLVMGVPAAVGGTLPDGLGSPPFGLLAGILELSPLGLSTLDGIIPIGHAALHSNFTKQYAATNAEPKKAAAHNHASPLASYLPQMAVTTALNRAKTLDATSNPK